MKIEKRRPAFEYKLVSDTDNLFGSIFEKTPVAIILLLLPDRKVLKANIAALNLFKVKSVQEFCDKHPSLFNKFSDENFYDSDFLEMELRLRNFKGGVTYLTAKARKFEGFQIILTLEDITQHKKREKRLLKLASMDGLTGILNHKTLMQRFKEEVLRAKKYHLPLSCFMFDIDDFKAFNDHFGHLEGDELLKKTAKALKEHTRESDIVGRYGGDEFLVILPETPLSEAWVPVKRIRSYFLNNPIVDKDKAKAVKNTFSIGLSGFPLKGIETYKDIIHHADKGLYESKLKGGNQVVLWSE